MGGGGPSAAGRAPRRGQRNRHARSTLRRASRMATVRGRIAAFVLRRRYRACADVGRRVGVARERDPACRGRRACARRGCGRVGLAAPRVSRSLPGRLGQFATTIRHMNLALAPTLPALRRRIAPAPPYNRFLLNVDFEAPAASRAPRSAAATASPTRSPRHATHSRTASSGTSSAGTTSSATERLRVLRSGSGTPSGWQGLPATGDWP